MKCLNEKLCNVFGEGFCCLEKCILSVTSKDSYFANFDYCGLLLEHNPHNKQGTTSPCLEETGT